MEIIIRNFENESGGGDCGGCASHSCGGGR